MLATADPGLRARGEACPCRQVHIPPRSARPFRRLCLAFDPLPPVHEAEPESAGEVLPSLGVMRRPVPLLRIAHRQYNMNVKHASLLELPPGRAFADASRRSELAERLVSLSLRLPLCRRESVLCRLVPKRRLSEFDLTAKLARVPMWAGNCAKELRHSFERPKYVLSPGAGGFDCFGSKRCPSTTAEATSTSFRFAERACSRSSKATASSTEWRSMRMHFARSVTALRPKAPSRSWYSAKRRSTMSIYHCLSSQSCPLGSFKSRRPRSLQAGRSTRSIDEEPARAQSSGYSSFRRMPPGSGGWGSGVRSMRKLKYGATNGSGADTV